MSRFPGALRKQKHAYTRHVNSAKRGRAGNWYTASNNVSPPLPMSFKPINPKLRSCRNSVTSPRLRQSQTGWSCDKTTVVDRVGVIVGRLSSIPHRMSSIARMVKVLWDSHAAGWNSHTPVNVYSFSIESWPDSLDLQPYVTLISPIGRR